MDIKSILQMISQTVDPRVAEGIPNSQDLVSAIMRSKAPDWMPGHEMLNRPIMGGGMPELNQQAMLDMLNKKGPGVGMPQAEAKEGEVPVRKVKTKTIEPPGKKRKAEKKEEKSEKERMAARMERENKYSYQKSPNRRPERPEDW